MHRNEWADVSSAESRTSLSKSEGPLHQLHVRRRKSGVDVASRRTYGLEFPAVYSRSDRLRVDVARPHQSHRFAEFTNHQRTHPVQSDRRRTSVRFVRHLVLYAQRRNARPQRYEERNYL